jgi:uncharacterized membrane protein YdbT with pleckstrin-like domain
MSYVESILIPGETVVYQTKLSLLIFMPTFLFGFITIIVAIFGSGLLLISCLSFFVFFTYYAIIKYISTELVVTSQRIILMKGISSRKTVEMNLKEVESVRLSQSMLGRALDYGTIHVFGTGMEIEGFGPVDSPLTLQMRIAK